MKYIVICWKIRSRSTSAFISQNGVVVAGDNGSFKLQNSCLEPALYEFHPRQLKDLPGMPSKAAKTFRLDFADHESNRCLEFNNQTTQHDDIKDVYLFFKECFKNDPEKRQRPMKKKKPNELEHYHPVALGHLSTRTDQRQKQIGNAQSTKNRGSTPEHNEGSFNCAPLAPGRPQKSVVRPSQGRHGEESFRQLKQLTSNGTKLSSRMQQHFNEASDSRRGVAPAAKSLKPVEPQRSRWTATLSKSTESTETEKESPLDNAWLKKVRADTKPALSSEEWPSLMPSATKTQPVIAKWPVAEKSSAFDVPQKSTDDVTDSTHWFNNNNDSVNESSQPDCDPAEQTILPVVSEIPQQPLFYGYRSLENIGNSCYMNSTLQALSVIPSFGTNMPLDAFDGKGVDYAALTRPLSQILSIVSDSRNGKEYDERTMRSTLHDMREQSGLLCAEFRSSRQQDVHEYITALLGAVDDQWLRRSKAVDARREVVQRCSNLLPRGSNPTDVIKICTSIKTGCSKCRRLNCRSDSAFDFALSFGDEMSIQELLDAEFAHSNIDSFKCESCGSSEGFTKQSISSAPKSLILVLKRYSFTDGAGRKVHGKARVSHPLYLGPLMTEEQKDDDCEDVEESLCAENSAAASIVAPDSNGIADVASRRLSPRKPLSDLNQTVDQAKNDATLQYAVTTQSPLRDPTIDHADSKLDVDVCGSPALDSDVSSELNCSKHESLKTEAVEKSEDSGADEQKELLPGGFEREDDGCEPMEIDVVGDVEELNKTQLGDGQHLRDEVVVRNENSSGAGDVDAKSAAALATAEVGREADISKSSQLSDVAVCFEGAPKEMNYVLIEEQDQKKICKALTLTFDGHIQMDWLRGEKTTFQTTSRPSGVYSVGADGNCLFRAIAWWITGGDEGQFARARKMIVNVIRDHKKSFEPLLKSNESIDDHIRRMRRNGEWGTQIELAAAATMLQCSVYTFHCGVWQRFIPVFSMRDGKRIRVSFNEWSKDKAIFLSNETGTHFNPCYFSTTDIQTKRLSRPYVAPEERRYGPKYILSAIINHVGLFVSSGHYVCFVRLPDNSWIKCNDEKVTTVSEDEVYYEASSHGYVYVYNRVE